MRVWIFMHISSWQPVVQGHLGQRGEGVSENGNAQRALYAACQTDHPIRRGCGGAKCLHGKYEPRPVEMGEQNGGACGRARRVSLLPSHEIVHI